MYYNVTINWNLNLPIHFTNVYSHMHSSRLTHLPIILNKIPFLFRMLQMTYFAKMWFTIMHNQVLICLKVYESILIFFVAWNMTKYIVSLYSLLSTDGTCIYFLHIITCKYKQYWNVWRKENFSTSTCPYKLFVWS